MNPPDPVKRRLHPVAAVLSMLRALRSAAPLLVLALIGGRDSSGALQFMLFLMVPYTLIAGIGSWLRFRYWIEGDELRIERGWLVRRRVFIPKGRIVAVDVTEGLLQRPFGLVKLLVKTAASGTQAELSAITQNEAAWLRTQLSPSASPETFSDTDPGPERLPEPRPRYQLGPGRLVFAASTSSKLGVIVSGLGWLYAQLDDFFEESILGSLQAGTGLGSFGPLAVAAIVVGAFALAWLMALVSEVLRFGGFAVERQRGDLLITRGVLEKRSVTIPVARVQAIRFSEGLLRQPFGYGTVFVESAGHAEEKGQSTVLHPLLHRSEWRSFLEQLTPDFSLEVGWRRPPARALPRFILRPVLFGTLLAGLLSWFTPLGLFSFLLYPPLLAYGWLCYRDSAAGFRGSFSAIRSRRLRRVTVAFQRRSIQSGEMFSSWFQRRRRLADLSWVAVSGSGPLGATATNLANQDCWELMNWYQGTRPNNR